MQKPIINIVSYGGGVDSTAMILKMVNEKMPIDYVIFADTGVEVPETYETVKHMKKFLDEYNIEFVTVKNFNKITLLQRCIKRKVFPDTYRRWCTRDFKVRPIHKFYKKILKELLVKNKIEINKKFYENKILHHTIHEYMGIDCKETKRLKIAKEPFIKKFYPLVDWKMERSDCIKYIADQGFPFTIKSGCFFCPYNSPTRWQWLKMIHPKLFKLSQELEKLSKHFPKMTLAKGGLDNVDDLETSEHDDVCGRGYS